MKELVLKQFEEYQLRITTDQRGFTNMHTLGGRTWKEIPRHSFEQAKQIVKQY
jgi:hypothetical protein